MTKTTTLIASLAALLCGNAALAATDSATESGDKVEMKYDAAAKEAGAKPFRAGTCTLRIVRTVDARQNKETIGQSMSGALLAGDVGPWMTEGLGHLQDFGYAVSTANPADATPAADGVTIRTSVTRAYTWQIGLKIFSMIAVKAEFLNRNGVLQQKYYRAHGDKTNMWGAKDEYVTTLNYGLNNLLPFVARDLQSLCKGEKVEGYSYAGPDGPPQ
ncbi:MAG: hypothetical protein ABI433_09350 [Burkholderiaceae bacterium]